MNYTIDHVITDHKYFNLCHLSIIFYSISSQLLRVICYVDGIHIRTILLWYHAKQNYHDIITNTARQWQAVSCVVIW